MTALYTGRFDPVTYGHIDVVKRAVKLTGTLIITVLDDSSVPSFFSIEERLAFIRDACGGIENIKIEAFTGLLASFAQDKGASAIIRGVRNASDFELETKMAHYNRLLTDGIDTVFIPANPEYRHISAGAVQETARLVYKNGFNDKILSALVTPMVRQALKIRLEVRGRT
jgi:pantetheine-phosphate adenylyltransferase